jgi:hypothetical protein
VADGKFGEHDSMAELIPSLNTCLPKMTAGEKRFARRLQELLEDDYPEVFQQRLRNLFNYQFPDKLRLPQIDRLRWHLFPEIRIGSQQAGIPFFWLATSSNKKQCRPDENRVNLMPIPSSKGLEFDRVLILDSSFIPARASDTTDKHGEEVRKLYVALTRAKAHLLISYHRDNALSRALESNKQQETTDAATDTPL